MDSVDTVTLWTSRSWLSPINKKVSKWRDLDILIAKETKNPIITFFLKKKEQNPLFFSSYQPYRVL